MSWTLQIIFYVLVSYIWVSAFLYYLSWIPYFVWYAIEFIYYPLNFINTYFFDILPIIYFLVSSLIFIWLYKVFKFLFAKN